MVRPNLSVVLCAILGSAILAAGPRQSVPRSQLSADAVLLKHDDDTAEGKRSIAGGGHAVMFDAPDAEDWYLTAIDLHGARYGPVRAPATMFTIALCDLDMRPIQTWKKPYAAVVRGEMEWVRFELPPTRVPEQFFICVDFHPTASNGIYVGIDDSTKGMARVATPGNPGSPLDAGTWMIRAQVNRPQAAPATGPAAAR